MPSLSLASPAKVNLVLDILEKRPDGYHEVEFVMQELALHDTVTIETIPGSSDITLTCTDPSVPLDARNTCHQAAQLMQAEAAKENKKMEGVHVHIEKRIPAAGGLGGGSSNAAAVLKGLNDLWKLKRSKDTLKELAAQIGSDVPFFIEGGTCIATGRGEFVTPIKKAPKMNFVFIVPPIKVPEQKTKWIYSHFDVNKVHEHPSIDAMEDAILKKDPVHVAQAMGNVFDTLTIPEYEISFNLITGLQSLSSVWKAMLAGAGPTVVAVVESEYVATQIIEPFRAKGWVAFATRSASSPTRK